MTIGLAIFFVAGRAISWCWHLISPLDLLFMSAIGTAFVWVHYRRPSSWAWPLSAQTRAENDAVRTTLRLRPVGAPPVLVVLGIAGLVLLQTGLTAIAFATRDPAFRLTLPLVPTADHPLVDHVVFIAWGAIFEEFSFRGWIQGSIEGRFGRVAAVLVSAALFAFVHTLPYGRMEVPWGPFVLGLLCGAAVIVAGSIWAAVLLHGAANLMVVLFSMFLAAGYRFGDAAWQISLFIASALVGSAILVAAGARSSARKATRGRSPADGRI